MKKTWKRLSGFLLACMMVCLPALQALAISYDAAAGLEPDMVLFPEDSLFNIAAPAVTLDGEPLVLEDPTTWKNETEDRAYQAGLTEDGSTLELVLAGYILTVEGGTSSAEEGIGGHKEYTEEEEKLDVAYYPVDAEVKLKADTPEEGMEFAGWKVDAEDVAVADPLGAETTLKMPEKKLKITASYQPVQAPEPETQAPDTEAQGNGEGAAPQGEDIPQEPQNEPIDPGMTDGTTDPGMTNEEIDPGMTNEQLDPGIVDVVIDPGAADGSADPSVGDPQEPQTEWTDPGMTNEPTDPGTTNEEIDPGIANELLDLNVDDLQEPQTEWTDPGMTNEEIDPGIANELLDLNVDDLQEPQSEWTDPGMTDEPTDPGMTNVVIDPGMTDGTTDPSVSDPQESQTEWTNPGMTNEPTDSGMTNEVIDPGMTDGTTDPSVSDPQGPQTEWTDPGMTNEPTDSGMTNEVPDPGVTNEPADPNAGSDPGIFGQGDDSAIEITTSDGYNSNEVNPTDTQTPETAPAAPEQPAQHTLTVEAGLLADGSTAGTYTEGEQVQLQAAAPAEGMQFSGWSAVTEAGETVSQDMFADAVSETTTFTMPADSVTVIAAYADMPYRAVVVNGIFADGTAETSCVAGTQLSLRAEAALAGAQFSKWTARFTDTGALLPDTEFANAAGLETTFTMPAGNVTVTAEYVTIASYSVEVASGLIAGGAVGPFTEGTQIALQANDPQPGTQFSRWTAVNKDTGVLLADSVFSSVTNAGTTFTVPACNVAVTAEYVPVQYKVTVANGLINNTSAEMMIPHGTVVTITANANPAGQVFSEWNVNNGTYDLGENAFNPSISVEITSEMNFAAVYEGVLYAITVNDGVANYEEAVSGTEITITADEAPEGMEFDYWQVDTQNVSLKASGRESTTFTMPMADVEVSAYYKLKDYYVTVQNGYADNDVYHMGQEVTIYSNYPSSGREFSQWTVVKGSAEFADASRWKTTFTMPASDVTVGATYKDGPSPSDNQIQELGAGAEYITNSTIRFTAAGAGMGNSNPNPGDYRYRPTGYQIGNVTGSWQASPYTTSMSIKAAGEYTLKVNYAKDVFDGSNWVPDGTSDAKSVTFRVVTPSAAVATGDTTPLTMMALLAGVSFLTILLMLCIRKRRDA